MQPQHRRNPNECNPSTHIWKISIWIATLHWLTVWRQLYYTFHQWETIYLLQGQAHHVGYTPSQQAVDHRLSTTPPALPQFLSQCAYYVRTNWVLSCIPLLTYNKNTRECNQSWIPSHIPHDQHKTTPHISAQIQSYYKRSHVCKNGAVIKLDPIYSSLLQILQQHDRYAKYPSSLKATRGIKQPL